MKPSRKLRRSAFTLAEAMVAIGIFGIYAAVAITAMLRLNNNAALSRLRTGASTVAQNQIDLILSDAPFNPKYNQVPPELTPTTAAYPATLSPITISGYTNPSTKPVYTDPTSGTQVMGTMTTWITDTGATLSAGSNNAGAVLYIYKATVQVTYQYRNKTYTATMNTLRASDL